MTYTPYCKDFHIAQDDQDNDLKKSFRNDMRIDNSNLPGSSYDFAAAGDHKDNQFQDELFNFDRIAGTAVIKQGMTPTQDQLRHRNVNYNNWLEGVQARERERKEIFLQKKRKDAMDEKRLEDEKKRTSSAKVQAWHAKKAAEAKMKSASQESQCKPSAIAPKINKENQKIPSFQAWCKLKNDQALASKLKKKQELALKEAKQQVKSIKIKGKGSQMDQTP